MCTERKVHKSSTSTKHAEKTSVGLTVVLVQMPALWGSSCCSLESESPHRHRLLGGAEKPFWSFIRKPGAELGRKLSHHLAVAPKSQPNQYTLREVIQHSQTQPARTNRLQSHFGQQKHTSEESVNQPTHLSINV